MNREETRVLFFAFLEIRVITQPMNMPTAVENRRSAADKRMKITSHKMPNPLLYHQTPTAGMITTSI